jgi:putative DNA primase/helicase
MADLSKVLGGPWSPPPEKRIAPPEEQLRDAMLAAGLEPPDELLLDGKIHRFKSGTKGSGNKGGDKPGWYLIFGDGVPAGRFGCWRAGVEVTWRAEVGRKLTATEEMANARRMAEAKALRDAELERKHEVAAATVETIWTSAQAASPDHPYLKRKGIGVHGARVTGDGRLVVPLYGPDGALASLQYIAHDGGKLYHPGGEAGGKFWMVGTMDEPGVLYVAEGFATAATIHETTGRPCVASYSASSLVPVTGSLREMYGPTQDIVIVADHDKHGVGQKYAEQASAKYGVRVVIPPIEGMDANDYAQAGNDLASLLMPARTDWLIAADDFSSQPAPISWLVKRWLQSQALIMVHGPSGGGKTFVVLDWCLRMASSTQDWCGNKVRAGNVVYLAGEGHHGLRGRVAAWKHHHQAKHLAMWLSKDGCDLNKPTGYLQVVEHLRTLPEKPAVIVVDTLHRFLNGDENSAQDAKTMLDACNSLMNEFCCSVILVHHTGVAEEAQHRARGSSAWRGALDIEISIVPGKENVPMQIVQRKSKDAELASTIYVELQQVTIPGWYDEDQQPVTSAVIVQAQPPASTRKDGKIDNHRKTFENAWWASGAEERNGLPYLSRSAMVDYLMHKMDVSETSAKQYIKPSVPGKPIADMLVAEIIEAFEHGWIVIDDAQASAMLIRKSER